MMTMNGSHHPECYGFFGMAGSQCDDCAHSLNCYMDTGVQDPGYLEEEMKGSELAEFYTEKELPAGSKISSNPLMTSDDTILYTEVVTGEDGVDLEEPKFRKGRWFVKRTGRFALVHYQAR